MRRLPDTSEEIGGKNRLVFRHFFVNYGFDCKEIIRVNSIVSETLTAATIADAQWRTGIIVVSVI